ncbi:MAG: hypothetical protein BAA01_01145 [Bacillus thermozeamaize]|uniref:CRISPR type III-associated protein domain-containing protein n=1 Tax=Bacillus thermozeamaize TaxID=230954 RepID=A0A1Y3PNW0_9BACI|nr:MAG: hypothetical protein BAA01_01145 [Bacillus thermozeamaize]
MKPYAFVQLSRKVEYAPLRPRNVLDPKLHHGKWLIRGCTLTPLIVRSGKILLHENRLVYGPILQNGHPVIPGSSLKGVVRSIYEAISHSCIQQPQGKKKDLTRYLPPEKQSPCMTQDRICPACQVFGFVGRGKENVAKSLVSFTDFLLQGQAKDWLNTELIPQLYQPRLEEAIRLYLDDEDVLQRKFYYHGTPETGQGSPTLVLKPGAVVEGEIHYQQMTDEELGRLAFSFGFGDPAFALKVGYAKPAYLGSIQFELVDVLPYQRLGFHSQPINRETILEYSRPFQQKMRMQVNQLLDIMDYDKHRHRTWQTNHQGQKGY